LSAENAALRSQAGLPPPSAVPPAGLQPGTVRHSGQLLLLFDGRADLDAPQNDPKWTPGAARHAGSETTGPYSQTRT
jgi:hypothetical protein